MNSWVGKNNDFMRVDFRIHRGSIRVRPLLPA